MRDSRRTGPKWESNWGSMMVVVRGVDPGMVFAVVLSKSMIITSIFGKQSSQGYNMSLIAWWLDSRSVWVDLGSNGEFSGRFLKFLPKRSIISPACIDNELSNPICSGALRISTRVHE